MLDWHIISTEYDREKCVWFFTVMNAEIGCIADPTYQTQDQAFEAGIEFFLMQVAHAALLNIVEEWADKGLISDQEELNYQY